MPARFRFVPALLALLAWMVAAPLLMAQSSTDGPASSVSPEVSNGGGGMGGAARAATTAVTEESQQWLAAAQGLYDNYGMSAFRVLMIVVFAWLLSLVCRRIARGVVSRISSAKDKLKVSKAAESRAKTLSGVFAATARVAIWIAAVLMILGELRVDYQPLLVATGGVTLAIGFGAQSLVKDVVSGIFILLEDQLSVDDVVDINGKIGVVERVNLRTTHLRSLDGSYHIIPNGSIGMVSSLTHEWARMVVDVGVSYFEDLEEVTKVINRVGQEMFAAEPWNTKLLEAPVVAGVEALGASSVDFRVLAKTQPGEQAACRREFRSRIKEAFDLSGIEIPFQYVNYVSAPARDPKILSRQPAAEGGTQATS